MKKLFQINETFCMALCVFSMILLTFQNIALPKISIKQVFADTTITIYGGQVDICHSSASDSNPYITNHPDADSIDFNGHDSHSGPVWYSGIANNTWGDIIPPFNLCSDKKQDYESTDTTKPCQKDVGNGNSIDIKYSDYIRQYTGKNWTTEGQAIYNNSCKIPGLPECIEDVFCSDSCRVEETTITGKCGPVVCKANAPKAESCPTECGQAASEVSDGACGKITCEATESCECTETVSCPNECRTENRVIEGNCGNITCKANAPKAESCPTECGQAASEVSDGACGKTKCEATPTCDITNTPTPTPTPTSTQEKPNAEHTGLYVQKLSCDEYDFKAEMEVKSGDNPLQDILVSFTYRNEKKDAYTNKEGYASVYFTFSDEGIVKATPNNGFESKEAMATQETNCQEFGAMSRTTDSRILSANTYAETGVFEDTMMSIMGLSGATMTAVGAKLNAKKKK